MREDGRLGKAGVVVQALPAKAFLRREYAIGTTPSATAAAPAIVSAVRLSAESYCVSRGSIYYQNTEQHTHYVHSERLIMRNAPVADEL